MSEDKTKGISDTRSFEERVFMRFDALDARFDAIEARFDRVEERLDRLEARVEHLEMKQYDTRPIWEQALAAIAETNSRIEQFEPFFAETTSRMAHFEQALTETNSRMAHFEQALTETNSRMAQFEQALTDGFANLRYEVANSIHGVERKIDSLNHNILQVQADQRYADQRLEKLERQINPT
jgi:chromosome segregation ATPase